MGKPAKIRKKKSFMFTTRHYSFMSILGIVLTVRSLLKIRTYIPENMLHEPFEGSLIEMWEKD